MSDLKPGDRVICRVRHHKIVSSNKYEEAKVFEIIGTDNNGCFLYVPEYYALQDTIQITQEICSSLHILSRYIGSQLIYVLSSCIVGLYSRLDGCTCMQCKEFYHYAQANRGDGGFICWACRNNPYR
jgi:hypothetical protein